MLALLLLLQTAVAAPDASTATLLTDVVSTSLAHDKRLDVVTTGELRQMLELEAQRQMVGCDATSCLGELAGATGARYVVFGNVGALGDELALTLQLFDSQTTTTAGRALVRGATVGSLADQSNDAVKTLLANIPASKGKVKVLVLALKAVGAVVDKTPAPTAHAGGVAGPLTVGGGALLAVLGVTSSAVSFIFDAQGDAAGATQAQATNAYNTRDALFVGGLVGAGVGLVVAGVGALVWASDG
jgi:hypothetical protein